MTRHDDDPNLRAALQDVVDLLERDGFTSNWRRTEGGLVFSVGVGAADCADCLAPEPVLRMMIQNAIHGTGLELERVEMPSAHA